MKDLTIHAVKVSAKIPETNLFVLEDSCKQKCIKYRRFNGSHLIVYDRYTFTFFKKSEFSNQHVNITKISDLNVNTALEDLARLINVQKETISFNVDNITACVDLGQQIDLEEFIHENQDLSNKINYNSERFPGLFLKCLYGKIILFKSGKIVFIGCKTVEELEYCNRFITKLTEKLTHC